MSGSPQLSDDLVELIESFRSHHVEFMVVGSHALAFYARPRFTEDVHLFVRRSKENVDRIEAALRHFGLPISAGAAGILASDPRSIMVLGEKPNQVDILNFLDGVDYSEAITRSKPGQLAGIDVRYIGIEDLIATKLASNRAKDIQDIEMLRSLGDDSLISASPDTTEDSETP